MTTKDKKDEYTKFASGIFVVKSLNGNFNSNFSGTPRQLPDEEGTIYATDKALKYCIRKYLLENGDSPIFAWRRRTEEGIFFKIDETYNYLFSSNEDELLKNSNKLKILKNLISCKDVRLFGVTFAPEETGKNISITGPVQISYGINKAKGNDFFTNQILSPFNPKSKQQTTIGDESKAIEVHYVYDFLVNPNHLNLNLEWTSMDEKDWEKFNQSDMNCFVEAICKGVNCVNSTTKIGSEGELLLLVEHTDPVMIQNLKEFISFRKENNKTVIILSDVLDYLKRNISNLDIKLYYDPVKTEIDFGEKNVDIREFNILNLEEINESEQ